MRILRTLLVAIGLAAPAMAQEVRNVPSATYASTPSTVLVDVREPNEWAETGMPKGSKGIPISLSDFVAKVLAEVGGDKSKPVAVICRSGARSARAAEQLKAAGFTNVTNIGDGMSGRANVGDGWLKASLPVQPYTPKPQ